MALEGGRRRHGGEKRRGGEEGVWEEGAFENRESKVEARMRC